MRIRLVTVTWGKSFTDIFLRITARSLLGAGNIAALAARHEVGYTIHTTAEDARVMRASSAMRRIEAALPVRWAIFAEGDIDPKNPSSHWILWRRAAEDARRSREILFFIIPDMLYATGTLLHWAALFQQGYRAVCAAGPQIVLETGLEEIEARFPPSLDAPISFDVPAVHHLQIRHMHPLMIAMFRDSGRWVRHPDTILAAVPGEGVVMRILASQPFCVDLNYFTVTDAFCPTDQVEAIAFDQPRTLCLEPMLKYADFYHRPSALSEDRLSNFGSWVDYFFGAPGDVLWCYHNARFLWRDVAAERSFRRAEAALGFFCCQMRLTGAIFRVLRALREAGCRTASQIGAAAHYLGPLRRHWRIKGAVTVLVPDDAALSDLGAGALEALLSEGNETSLIDVVFAHVFPGTLALRPGDCLDSVEGGEGTAPVAPVVKVTAGPITIDDCTIYVIDRPLSRGPAEAVSRPRPVLPNRWSAIARRVPGASGPAPRASGAASVPSQPSTAAPPRELTRRSYPMLRRVLRGGYRVALRVPGLRPLAAFSLSVYEAILWERRQRAPDLSPSAAAWSAAAMPPAAAKTQDTASGGDVAGAEAFALLQAGRVVLNLRELLRFYRTKMGELGTDLPPLAMVEGCVDAARLDEQRLIQGLRELTRDAPDFAEAWLELGYIHLDRNEVVEAQECFDRTLAGQPMLPVAEGRTSCKALAAFARAQILSARGATEAAVDAYNKAFAIDFRPTMMHVACGRVLRRLGKFDESLAEWEASMHTDDSAVTLPPLPRDFALLVTQLVKSRVPTGNVEMAASVME